MYNYELKPSLQKILNKLSKKDINLYRQVLKKIEEIISSESIEHYKNLGYNSKELKRVHIEHFVLVFKYDRNRNLISFENFDYHDNIHKK